MQSHTTALSSPIRWIRRGVSALREAPLGLGSIIVFYVFMMSVLTALPFIGLVVAALFMPFGTMLVMNATKDAERALQPNYQILFSLVKDPSLRMKLFRIGIVYGGFLVVANFAYAITAMDEIAKWQVQDGRLVWDSVFSNLPYTAIILTVVIYTLGQMATWFAPALVVWKNMSVTKAIFYSFFGCLRNWLPIFILLIIIVAMTSASAVVLSFLLDSLQIHNIAVFIVVPAALALTAISYSTIWPMWADIYGNVTIEE